MTYTDNEKQIIAQAIADVNEFGHKSYYLAKENALVRVSDHEPNMSNVMAYNEECDTLILITKDEISQSWIDAAIDDYEYSYNKEIQIIAIAFDDISDSCKWFEFPEVKFA